MDRDRELTSPQRARRWPRALATVLPAWLHIAWLVWVVPLLRIFVSANEFRLLNVLWIVPIGVMIYGSLRGWVREWVIWALIVMPYGALIIRAGLTGGS